MLTPFNHKSGLNGYTLFVQNVCAIVNRKVTAMFIGLVIITIAYQSILAIAWVNAINIPYNISPLKIAPSFFAVSFLLIRYQILPGFAVALSVYAAITMSTALSVSWGYIIYFLGQDYPLIDLYLLAFDRAIGFDWLAFLQWQNDHSWFNEATLFAYTTAPSQIILALPILLICKQEERLYHITIITLSSLIIIHCIAYFMPAIGSYGYLGVSPADHPDIYLFSQDHSVQQVLELRSISQLDINSFTPLGLISFPSFHTAMAIIFTWCFWPIKAIRYPVMAFNIFVLLGTITHGSHYISEMLAGAFVTYFCILFSRRFLQFCENLVVNLSQKEKGKGDIHPSPILNMSQKQ